MASESTVVLCVPIPSTNPLFLAIIGVHVLFGLTAVITGAAAMLSQKGRCRHSNFVTIYFWCLFGVFVKAHVTASDLILERGSGFDTSVALSGNQSWYSVLLDSMLNTSGL